MTELGVLAPAGELVDPRRHLLEEAGHSGETLVELPGELPPLGLEPPDRPGDVTRLDLAVLRNDVALDRPLPQRILVDNGTPFTSKPLDAWAYWNQVKLDSSRRGKPGDNAHIEAFNSLVRRECLSQHLFMSLEEAGGILERWKEEYNNDRPHGSLRQMRPARYRAGGIPAPGPGRARYSQIGWIRKEVSCPHRAPATTRYTTSSNVEEVVVFTEDLLNGQRIDPSLRTSRA